MTWWQACLVVGGAMLIGSSFVFNRDDADGALMITWWPTWSIIGGLLIYLGA